MNNLRDVQKSTLRYSFYLGAIVFKFADLAAFARAARIPNWVFVSIGAAFAVALLFCVFALQIRTYEGLFDPEGEIRSFGDVAPTDSDFLDARIIDLAVATNRNSHQNDRVANYLSVCAGLLVAAASAQIVLFAISIRGD